MGDPFNGELQVTAQLTVSSTTPRFLKTMASPSKQVVIEPGITLKEFLVHTVGIVYQNGLRVD